MSQHLNFAKVWCLALSISASVAFAAPAATGTSVSGNFMGGFYSSWMTGSEGQGFLVDRAALKMTHSVSDKTKFVFNKAVFAGPVGTNTLTQFNSSNFTSNFAVSAGNFALAAEAAYVDHKCGEGMHTWVGLFGVPFGMESMWDRSDMASYYYSSFYRNAYAGQRLNFDLGVKLAFSGLIPGNLEVAIMDGRNYQNATTTAENVNMSPAVALRYSNEMKSGDMSFTPVASVYLGRFSGFAKTWMASAGVIGKMGALGINAEFLYGSDQAIVADGIGKDKRMSFYVEPSFDMGFMLISAKAEYETVGLDAGGATGTVADVSDFNVGGAISHTYEGDFTIKLAYAHAGLGSKIAGQAHVNDLRLLFSTKF